MSFLTASLISPMYNSALFDHGVPSSIEFLDLYQCHCKISSLQRTLVLKTCQPPKSQVHQFPWQIA